MIVFWKNNKEVLNMKQLAFNKHRETTATRYKWSRYNVTVAPSETSDGQYILYNTASGKMIASPRGFHKLEEHYQKSAALIEGLEDLVEKGFLVPEFLDELAFTRSEMERKHSQGQHLIIMPTEQCNFRCVYCYEDFLKGKLSPELQDGLIRWVAQNIHRFGSLSVDWFGGEPLVGYDVVVNLSKHLTALCEQHNIPYRSAMTTNGYLLTLERATVLRELGVTSFQISLDGLEEAHDHHRRLAGGQGTFATIMKNLTEIKNSDLDLNIIIRSNFTRDNKDGLKDFIDELHKLLGSDKRFGYRLFPVGKWGGDHDDELPICTPSEAREVILEHAVYAADRGLNTRVYEKLQPHRVCYAANPNSLVFGSDGTLYKCTVAFENPINQVGKLLPEGMLEIDYQKFSQWTGSDGLSDTECQKCQLHPVCHGASCPLIRIETGMRPCPAAKSDLTAYVSVAYYELTKEGNSP
jgi:uncharacterized protein